MIYFGNRHTMSRLTKYTVKLGNPKSISIEFKVSLSKSFDEHSSFKQTYPDPSDPSVVRLVRTIKVLTQDSVKPACLADIQQIVPWNEVQSSLAVTDEHGKEILFPIDKEVIGKIYKKSDIMSSMGFIDQDLISPCDYEGSHYFLTVQRNTKTKECDSDDIKVYSTIQYIIEHYRQYLMVKFVSGEREKIGVIYSNRKCLMLSTIIHSTYQRTAPVVETISLPANIDSLACKLIKSQKLESLDKSQTEDKYEQRVQEYLSQVRQHKDRLSVKLKKIETPKNDFFSLLADL